jgi:UDP-N-acetylglucosamine transferase subunit ALG13
MILVTVGTERFPFNRLMTWLEALIQAGFLNPDDEDIVVQSGTCTIVPPGVRVYQLLPEAQFQKLIQQARLVIAHCGEGSSVMLEQSGKPYILVPRCHAKGEHVDDHQIEMATAFAQAGVPIAWSPADIVRFLVAPERGSITVPEIALRDVCQRIQTRFSPKVSGVPVSILASG